jgi:hypothetical protein
MGINLVIASTGTASSGSATTLVDSDLATTYADDYYNNCIIEITAGTGKGEVATVTDYTGASGTFTFTALSGGSTPDTTSEYAVGHRYKLADNFGGSPDGPIHYVRESNNGSPIDWTHESSLRSMRENVSYSGDPMYAAIRPYGTRQFELIIYPDPTSVDVLEFPYTLFFDNMRLATGLATGGTSTTLVDSTRRLEVDDYFNGWVLTVRAGTGLGETATITDFVQSTATLTFTALSGGSTPDTTTVYSIEPTANLHPAGYRFDDIISTACRARAEMEIEDLAAGWKESYDNRKLDKAYNIDAKLAPRKVTRSRGRPFERVWKDITYN